MGVGIECESSRAQDTRRTISLIINHMLIVKANSSVISSGQLIVVDLIIRYGCLAISCLAIS